MARLKKLKLGWPSTGQLKKILVDGLAISAINIVPTILAEWLIVEFNEEQIRTARVVGIVTNFVPGAMYGVYRDHLQPRMRRALRSKVGRGWAKYASHVIIFFPFWASLNVVGYISAGGTHWQIAKGALMVLLASMFFGAHVMSLAIDLGRKLAGVSRRWRPTKRKG